MKEPHGSFDIGACAAGVLTEGARSRAGAGAGAGVGSGVLQASFDPQASLFDQPPKFSDCEGAAAGFGAGAGAGLERLNAELTCGDCGLGGGGGGGSEAAKSKRSFETDRDCGDDTLARDGRLAAWAKPKSRPLDGDVTCDV